MKMSLRIVKDLPTQHALVEGILFEKRLAKKSYPAPPDMGDPPDVIRDWAEKIITSWGLTPKETEVCHLILKGFSTKELAEVTGNTEKTLKHHIASIFGKAHVTSRAELFAEIFRL